MRRLALPAIMIVLAAAAIAGTPHSLDRSGVLWTASSGPEGLLLTAQRDGRTLVQSTVPFAVAAPGATDSEIQVAADDLTGKVAVVWQRNWSSDVSDIMLAVWNEGAWERVAPLSSDMSARPRFPAIQLSRVRSTVPDAEAPDDPSRVTVVEDSFLNIVWWEGFSSAQHGLYGLVCLTAAADEAGAVYERNLDDLLWLGSGCAFPAPQSVLERPLIASQPATDRAYLFHGSRRACLFQLVEVTFVLDNPASGIIVSAQRRRHTPVFGVKKLFAVPSSMSLDGARIVLGTDLNPVAYRVTGSKIEYISSSGVKWSPKRSLTVDSDLRIDQAIPLVESLAR
jgi:hypothetical protein